MHVPTTSDYPGVSEELFKNPKSALYSAVQGLATLDRSYVTLAPEVFQCTLRYESLVRTEVAEAEGRSKVRILWVLVQNLMLTSSEIRRAHSLSASYG